MRRRPLIVLATVMAIALLPAPLAIAQEESPAPAPSLFPPVPGGHPAHIHFGNCPTPGDIAFGLSHLSDQHLVDGQPNVGDTVGSPDAVAVLPGTTTVASDLLSLADGNHSINVHLSDADMGTYIACGDIGGALYGPDTLALGLAAQNDSGVTGVGWIKDNGDGTSTVRVILLGTSGAP